LRGRADIRGIAGVHGQADLRIARLGRLWSDDGCARVSSGSSWGLQVMEPIRHHDPTHLAERIERRAHLVGGWAWTVNPQTISRETNDGSTRSQANTAEPYRTLGDPDGIWHDDFEHAGRCHEASLPSFGFYCTFRRSPGRLGASGAPARGSAYRCQIDSR